MQLLNCLKYVIKPQFDPERKVDIYGIFDAASGCLLGAASEREPALWLKTLRWLWGRHLFRCMIEVREQGRPSSAFLVREGRGFWSPRLQVIQPSGDLVCSFKPKFAVLGGGFTVHDASGERIGELDCPTGEASYRFIARNGAEIGTIVQESSPASTNGESVQVYTVAVHPWEQDQSLAGLLLISAALSLDILYRERV